MTLLSIIIPAYNEEATIHKILEKVDNVKLINDIEKEVIIVNDSIVQPTIQLLKLFN